MSTATIGPDKLFPFKRFRDEQEAFITKTYETLEAGNHVIASAPNGFGKTISVLCATLPVAIENDLKVVYCCRTHVQNSRVITELEAIHKHLLGNRIVDDASTIAVDYSGVSLRGRNEMCFKDQIRETDLSPGDSAAVCAQLRKDSRCKYYKNFQKLLAGAEHASEPVLERHALDSDAIIAACTAKGICPYFFSRDLLKSARVSVGNYQWFFNPWIQDRFLESIGVGIEDVLLVIDEAHNLPSLSEEIHSLRMGKFTITSARKEMRDYFPGEPGLEPAELLLRASEDLFDSYERGLRNQEEIEIDARAIIQHLQSSTRSSLAGAIELLDDRGDEIQKQKLETGRKSPRSFCKAVAQFWSEWQSSTMDKAAFYHCFSTDRGRKYSSNYTFEAVCLDPGLVGIKKIMDNVYASISLSGTIIPEAYSAICRVPRPEILRMNSPFDPAHVKTIILDDVSTAKGQRSEEMYRTYLGKIVEMARATPKNSAAFCASYGVLRGIVDAGFEGAIRHIGRFPLVEKEGGSSSENDDLIAQYKEYSRVSDGAVLLGVTGGRNSEGEDFPGDEMNAVMVVGVPYATPTPRVKKKIEYYDVAFEDNRGWSLAYEIPAVQKANQACGRPIRTLDDRAVIVLADARFKKDKILALLSPWILRNICAIKDVPGHLYASIERFFAGAAQNGCT
ncbi:MAG: ATP-dependent DNA helicase [Candidatus Lokiarchaeota archaeon]|nr:ATP-dependent DNA helicase [Candidatus Lokiarchaeota archaeon]